MMMMTTTSTQTPTEMNEQRAPLMLSVSGARGVTGSSMTPPVAATFAGAFGSHLRETSGETSPVVIVGRDSRPSGEMLAMAAISGLIGVGCRVIDLGVQMTPTVGVMINHRRAHGGIVVTASHNPMIWNGLKCLNADGVAPPPREAEQIIARFRASNVSWCDVHGLHAPERETSSVDVHVDRVLSHVAAEPVRASSLSVVLDSVNGAGCTAGRTLLDSLGVDVRHMNCEPTGHFAHTPEPIEENLHDLMEAVVAEGAMAGFAQDPDADRLAVVDERGRYIGEEYTLVLCAKRALDRRASSGEYGMDAHQPCVLAANLSTSRMLDDLASRYEGVSVVRTPVGEANVVDAMKHAHPEALIGGEGNGGVIVPEVCWVRDSLSAMALILDLMASEDRALSSIVDDLPRYAMIKRKFDLTQVGGLDAVSGMLNRIKDAFQDERVDDADGVRVDFAEGWVHIRPSNTEPILRLIAEAPTAVDAEALITRVREAQGNADGAPVL